MGYVAARGGLEAIAAAERLVRRKRMGAPSDWLGLDQLVERQRLAVDRVMGEGGLWDPELAAVALRQAEGDVIEAAHLLRAHRSTLPRIAYSRTVDADDLEVLRRIVPAYRNPPGPQLLGRTSDYTGRLIELLPEGDLRSEAAAMAAHVAAPAPDDVVAPEEQRRPGRLLDLLRSQGLLVERSPGDGGPFDITRKPARPPAPRSARLATMARAETGALVNMWYRNVLGPDGYLHEVTLGEVRHGWLPVPVTHPHTGGSVTIGRVRATEVEAIEDLDGPEEDRGRFDAGYGLCLGHNERKAIAMANLDISCHRDAGRSSLEQSVLLTTDGLDASGFLEHLKLPHYVTFRSMVERKQAVRAARGTRATVAVPTPPGAAPLHRGEEVGVESTTDSREATAIQTRHRVPEDPLGAGQVLVLQVPVPEPLRGIEKDMRELQRMHAEGDYARMWVSLYEDKVRNGVITQTTGYPCLVGGRYVIATTPIPRWDVAKLHRSEAIALFGAGREKRIYAIPPHTDVETLTFDDVPFEVERTPGARCRRCGSDESFLVEVPTATDTTWVCSDSDWCERRATDDERARA